MSNLAYDKADELEKALLIAAEQKVGMDKNKQKIQIDWWRKLAALRDLTDAKVELFPR